MIYPISKTITTPAINKHISNTPTSTPRAALVLASFEMTIHNNHIKYYSDLVGYLLLSLMLTFH